MEENYLYHLRAKLKYSKDGSFEETATIEFTPPDMSVFDESSDFEQLCMGSVMSATKGMSRKDKEEKPDENEEDKTPTAEEIRMLLFSSQDIKFKDIAKVFKKIAFKTGKLDDKIYLTQTHFDKMGIKDFKDMICGYAAFFIFPSLLKGE